jgi:mRNA interferase MazF
MNQNYIPQAGDVVWLEFDPQVGYEQAGRRPALVLSPFTYNNKTNLIICCPITSKVKNYPFEVLTELNGKTCSILSDQIKSLDWKKRRAQKITQYSDEIMIDVRAKIKALIF